MNTIRMFAFVAAVLITVLLFRVIADGLTDAPASQVATESRPADHQAAGD